MLNVDLKNFKNNHKKKLNQVLFYSIKTNGLSEINNLINNLNQNDGPYLMVTHYVVIQAFTGISLPSGGMAVYDLKAQKAYDLKIDN